MKRVFVFLSIAWMALLSLTVQGESNRYRVWLTDKNESSYSTSRPEEFMSPAAIERRERQGITFDTYDLPVNKHYLDEITKAGGEVIVTSRWMNTAVVACNDSATLRHISELPFVSRIEWVWSTPQAGVSPKSRMKTLPDEDDRNINNTTPPSAHEQLYGLSWTQVSMLNLDSLHRAGYSGEGMTIAVVDAGFTGIDNIAAIDKSHIIGRYDLLKESFDTTGNDHGTSALSCMAAYDPCTYIGTAPKADYILIITEDITAEHAFEEDMWVRGVELADSLGAQIISSSLCYTEFDEPWMSYTVDELDGHTAFSTRGANIAAQKGILVVTAAGNEYLTSWHMLGFPSDAEQVMTVGGVDATKQHSRFSSEGYVNERDVKPNIVAMATSTQCYKQTGEIAALNGTSFSTPLITGGMACLWQALPQLGVRELIELVEKSASQYHSPDSLLGHGVPDFYAAYNYLSGTTATQLQRDIYITHRTLHLPATAAGSVVTLYNIGGNKVWQATPLQGTTSLELEAVERGLYLVTVTTPTEHRTLKIFVH